ncbi:hypothetical protein [Neobacillus sp. NPDC093127]|uniref:hypothetical protein n=1 Tax=Neobacillus sp. NPDC093127 TaxID=3364296 RepID=UPI00382E13E2
MAKTPSTDQVFRTMQKVIDDIAAERWRQIAKYGHQSKNENADWLAVLVEEVGEVCQALQKGTPAEKTTDASNLYMELIQVSAVAAKWAETVRGYK